MATTPRQEYRQQHEGASIGALVTEIIDVHRERQDAVRDRIALENHNSAVARRHANQVLQLPYPASARITQKQAQQVFAEHPDLADEVARYNLPRSVALTAIREREALLTWHLEELAMLLPVWAWVSQVRGVGALSLGKVVGEAGDIGGYANPAKLWKRMGLAVIDGRAQRKVTGEEALIHGFSPERRAVMAVVGESILRAKGELKGVYDTRRVYEAEQHPELRKIAHHLRALRYAEKRFLRGLWRAWRVCAYMPRGEALTPQDLVDISVDLDHDQPEQPEQPEQADAPDTASRD